MGISMLPFLDPEIGSALIVARDERFGPALLCAAQRLGDVEEVFAFSQEETSRPIVIASSSGLPDSASRVALYTQRFHRFDPVARARVSAPVGSGFAQTISANEIRSSDYLALCFERPRFVEKLCFGWHFDRRWFVLSFYRRRSGTSSNGQLAALANLALSAMMDAAAPQPPFSEPLAIRLKRRLACTFPDLTPRELEVCARTLAGDTAACIAGQLGISRASVLTYRQRAYRRLRITQANALLSRLLD